MHVKNHLKI